MLEILVGAIVISYILVAASVFVLAGIFFWYNLTYMKECIKEIRERNNEGS